MKTTLLISAFAVSLNACAIDQVDVDPTDTDDVIDQDDRPTHEKLSANALLPSDLGAIPIGALTQAYSDSLSQTKGGRASLIYLVNCALAAGDSISSEHSCNPLTHVCQTITYDGGIGLMPNWKTTTPTQAQQRQLSSCVLARLNEFGRTLTISLRGSAYSLDTNETTTHVYPEGAFFGNVFAGSDNYWGSCDSVGATHPWRQCAQSGHCSVDWAGDCATACTVDANSNMTSCTGANGETYAQPTTVFLSSVTL